MTDSEQILSDLLCTTRFLQTEFRDGIDTASGASLRSMLKLLLKELDTIEWETSTVTQSRGFYFDGFPPLSYLFSSSLNRIRLYFQNKDSDIAEMLIQFETKAMIRTTKHLNASTSTDPTTQLLAHRFLSFIRASIRNLQEYL